MKFRCRCGVERTQNIKKGYQNLASHIKEHHNDWQDIMESAHLEDSTEITRFVNKKASTVFSWLEWVIMTNLPFVFVESALTRKIIKLDFMSEDTLMKYLKLLTVEVENRVSNELSEKFGIVIDGWFEENTHYIAVFAS